MKNKIKKRLNRAKQSPESPEAPPRITNDTVAAHREEVLGEARRYIYPLRHSKHRLVVITLSILAIFTLAFLTYTTVSLYKMQSTSEFMYKVTKVLPFPIARTGSSFVSYNDYLFEINHYMHYYRTQQQLDFNSDAGQRQLAEFKKRALDKVINDAYIKKIAQEKGVSVSDKEVDDQISIVREQNRLGGNQKELEAVLEDFWGWSIDDFKQSLKRQLLAQKVLSKLDTDAHNRANSAYAQLQAGKDFQTLAKEVSEDPSTKANGGDYGFQVDKTNRDISAVVVQALFGLKPGEYSKVVDAGYGLEIVKNIEQKEDKIRAAHIVFNFKNINEYLNDVKDKQPTRAYIRL